MVKKECKDGKGLVLFSGVHIGWEEFMVRTTVHETSSCVYITSSMKQVNLR